MSNSPECVYSMELVIKEKHKTRKLKVSEGVYKYKSGGHFTKARLINDFLEWAIKHKFVDYRLKLKHREIGLLDKRAFI